MGLDNCRRCHRDSASSLLSPSFPSSAPKCQESKTLTWYDEGRLGHDEGRGDPVGGGVSDKSIPAPCHVNRHGGKGEYHHASLVDEEVLIGGDNVLVQLLLGVGRDEGAL